jgi:hypothetical protein
LIQASLRIITHDCYMFIVQATGKPAALAQW